MDRYPIPAASVRVEHVVLRSRFITTAGPAASVDEARAFVAAVRSEFADASHNCYAFVAGPPGSSGQVGMSDDGEPSGTAGRPMLAVLAGSGIGDIVAVVTRYFGGTKLGTGGLVRAYSEGVKLALADLPQVEKRSWALLLISGDYKWVTPLDRLLPGYEALVVDREFAALVTWTIKVPADRAWALEHAIGELANGTLEMAWP